MPCVLQLCCDSSWVCQLSKNQVWTPRLWRLFLLSLQSRVASKPDLWCSQGSAISQCALVFCQL